MIFLSVFNSFYFPHILPFSHVQSYLCKNTNATGYKPQKHCKTIVQICFFDIHIRCKHCWLNLLWVHFDFFLFQGLFLSVQLLAHPCKYCKGQSSTLLLRNSNGGIPVCFLKKRAKNEELVKCNSSEIDVMLRVVERNNNFASRKTKYVSQ